MIGNRFTDYIPPELKDGSFEQLLKIFMQLVTITSGDVSEALNWMNEVDRQYNLTDDEYGMGDFIEEMKDKGYLTQENEKGEIKITPKTEQGIRKRSLEEIFGKLKKTGFFIDYF